ncbi:MAG: HD domain-containing protein [Nitrospirae bacterium]|nr:MAG: HD domain-containing protein [Nitrospirota bacterium]
MTPQAPALSAPYDGSALIADPIHQYISFTVPYSTPDHSERTEKDLIDSPWVQRLRSIYQLQSARWVYPSAEHSRFVHSLGTMHVAGQFARHLHPFLEQAAKDVPSANYVESLLRVTALVHDIGHGPFCHFFDDNFLTSFHLTHEKLGQLIIRDASRFIHVRRRGRPGGPDQTHPLHTDHQERLHDPQDRSAGVADVLEHPDVPLFQRVFPPDDARHRHPFAGDLRRHHAPDLPSRPANEDGRIPDPHRLVPDGRGPWMEQVPARDEASPRRGVGTHPGPRREVEDGLQHGPEREGSRTRDGFSES